MLLTDQVMTDWLTRRFRACRELAYLEQGEIVPLENETIDFWHISCKGRLHMDDCGISRDCRKEGLRSTC